MTSLSFSSAPQFEQNIMVRLLSLKPQMHTYFGRFNGTGIGKVRSTDQYFLTTTLFHNYSIKIQKGCCFLVNYALTKKGIVGRMKNKAVLHITKRKWERI